MDNGQSLPREPDKFCIGFEDENDENDAKPSSSSTLNTDRKSVNKCVSFSDFNEVFLIPKNKKSSGGRNRRCGYLLDAKQTFTNLLDEKCLEEINGGAEVQLASVLFDQQVVNDKPNESPPTPDINEVVVYSGAEGSSFESQERNSGFKPKENLPVGLVSKSTLSYDDFMNTRDSVVSFRFSGDGSYSFNIEGSRGNRFKQISVEEMDKERSFRGFRRLLQNTTTEDDPDKAKQEDLKERSEDIGSQTCDAIKSYIVGLSDHCGSRRFSSIDLIPVYVAVKGTLGKKVIRKDSDIKSKNGLDLVGTHNLRNQNINCAIRFYYDKDTKEIAEKQMVQR